MEKTEYVLVSQGIEIARSENFGKLYLEMIHSNIEWRSYVEECIENNESYADNEVFLYKEENGKIVQWPF